MVNLLYIKIENHPVFENIEIDFRINNLPPDNIIIAGNNGSGKTLLLEIINSTIKCSNFEFSDYKSILIFSYEEPKGNKIDKLNEGFFEVLIEKKLLNLEVKVGTNKQLESVKFYSISTNNDLSKGDNLIEYFYSHKIESINKSKLDTILKRIYLKSNFNFTKHNVVSTTALNLDKNEIGIESNENTSKELKQLLIDIFQEDANEFLSYYEMNNECMDDASIGQRKKRFTKAYSKLIEGKIFKNIERKNNIINLMFEEYGKPVEINELSSGEKQIIFKSTYILMNQNSMKGAIVLFDEPELNLHPDWQLKTLDYYKTLLSLDNNQTSQLVLTTHSPFILENINPLTDKVIILNKKEGIIRKENNPEFYSIGNKELIKQAFGIDYDKYFENNNYILFEGKIDLKYFKKTAEIYELDITNVKLDSIGYTNKMGANDSGYTALNRYFDFFSNKPIFNGKYVFVYDCDCDKVVNENNKKCFKHKLNKVESPVNYYIGIENLLNIEKELFDKYVETKDINNQETGFTNKIQSLNKTKLCEFIIDMNDLTKQKEILENIKKELENILLVFNETQ